MDRLADVRSRGSSLRLECPMNSVFIAVIARRAAQNQQPGNEPSPTWTTPLLACLHPIVRPCAQPVAWKSALGDPDDPELVSQLGTADGAEGARVGRS